MKHRLRTDVQDFDRLRYPPGAPSIVRARGVQNAGIVIRNTELKTAAKDFDLSTGATRDAFRVA
jgi:hypothetical protein